MFFFALPKILIQHVPNMYNTFEIYGSAVWVSTLDIVMSWQDGSDIITRWGLPCVGCGSKLVKQKTDSAESCCTPVPTCLLGEPSVSPNSWWHVKHCIPYYILEFCTIFIANLPGLWNTPIVTHYSRFWLNIAPKIRPWTHYHAQTLDYIYIIKYYIYTISKKYRSNCVPEPKKWYYVHMHYMIYYIYYIYIYIPWGSKCFLSEYSGL